VMVIYIKVWSTEFSMLHMHLIEFPIGRNFTRIIDNIKLMIYV
jgi:hypothetical protein